MSNGHGGARPGSGRKRKADEDRTRDLALAAIKEKYGGEQEGFTALLNSPDPTLKKWVFEHAYGKPKDIVDVTTRTEETRIVDIGDDGEEMVDGPEGDDDQEYQDEMDAAADESFQDFELHDDGDDTDQGDGDE